MHQKKRKIAVAAGTTVLFAVVAACGNSATTGSTASSEATSQTSTASTPAPIASQSPSSAPSAAPVGSSASAPSSSAVGASAATGASSSAAPAVGLTSDPATAGQTINVLMVNNPQMVDLQNLTAANFTAKTGIKVNYTVLPENDMRNKASLEFKNQAGQYDVSTLSNVEASTYAKNGWLTDLSPYVKADPSFDQADIFPAFTQSLSYQDKIYGEPFYGESSFMMYRKDVFAAKGLTMPANPTWTQIADLAAKVDGAQPGMKGICLRGEPGWGQMGGALTTVVNTFGGTWFNKDWSAQVNQQPFKDAVNFYINLVKAHGEVGASTAGYTECLTAMLQSKVAMWYDATVSGGTLEAAGSPVAGKVGYAQAPVEKTKASGWLYAWSWLMEKKSAHPDAAWKFISWASSKQYENLAGNKVGWAKIPAGKRTSTYAIPEYNKAAAAFGPATLEAFKSANPLNPGLQPRPTASIQFVAIPEFAQLGDDLTKDLSSVIAGNGSVDAALNKSQSEAQQVGDTYK